MGWLKKRKDFETECYKLKFEIKERDADIAKLQELLDAQLKAKENGCYRGQYCAVCKHGVVIRGTCYCTYGQCAHFEKGVEELC